MYFWFTFYFSALIHIMFANLQTVNNKFYSTNYGDASEIKQNCMCVSE